MKKNLKQHRLKKVFKKILPEITAPNGIRSLKPPDGRAAKGQNRPVGSDQTKPVGSDQNKPTGSDHTKPVGSDQTKSADSEQNKPADSDQNKPAGSDQTKPAGSDQNKPVGLDHTKPAGSDQNKFAGSDHTKRSPYINLLQDLMFKTYFSKNPQVLCFLLNAFLPLPEGKTVQKATVLNKPKEPLILDSFVYPSTPKNKLIVLDLRVQLNTKELVNVEMQSTAQTHFLKRILYYWSRLYTETLPRGNDYKELHPAYSLVFTTFDVFQDTQDVVTSFSVRSDRPPHFALNNQLRIVLVELSKFRAMLPGDLFDLRDLWCYTLKRSGRMGRREWEVLFQKGREMKMAMKLLKFLSNDESVRFQEEAWEKFQRDLRGQREYAIEQGMKQGMKQGMEQGRQQGMKQGMEQGREQGRQEGRKQGMEQGIKQEREHIALKMLKQGYPVSSIEKITGLSKTQIEGIHRD